MDNVEVAINDIESQLSQQHQYLLEQSPEISSSINEEMKTSARKVRRELSVNYPHGDNEMQLIELTDNECSLPRLKKAIKAYKKLCKDSKTHFNNYWEEQLSLLTISEDKDGQTVRDKQREIESVNQLLIEQWRKLHDKLKSEWELDQISKWRERLLKAFLDKLKTIAELFKTVQSLGLEPGVLFDLSSGELSVGDIEPIKRWLEYLKNDSGVQALIDLMGRMSQVEQSTKIERVKQTAHRTVNVPDINSKEEIVGLRLGNDLEHALPSELALMGDTETSILFDLKYIESGLMCFDLQGMDKVTQTYEIEVEQEVSEDESKGPMIICVDTSGSMHGAPETIAKAITMAMVLKAKQDKRSCYLINFSTSIETLDLSGGFAIENLLSFLQKSFHGGTDVAPAISDGLTKMATAEYKNADMLIISDFVMASLPQTLLDDMSVLREQGNKFNSLVVDSCFMEHRLKSIFDTEWVYDPRTSNIIELINFQERCTASAD